jgi:uncharacterized membrane protein YebE (DUF533 family)
LQQALKEVLADDNKVSKFEARVLREMILADGQVTGDERKLLEESLDRDQFDPEAFELLSQMVVRAKTGPKKHWLFP